MGSASSPRSLLCSATCTTKRLRTKRCPRRRLPPGPAPPQRPLLPFPTAPLPLQQNKKQRLRKTSAKAFPSPGVPLGRDRQPNFFFFSFESIVSSSPRMPSPVPLSYSSAELRSCLFSDALLSVKVNMNCCQLKLVSFHRRPTEMLEEGKESGSSNLYGLFNLC